jgi:hypothetical protein
MPYEGMVGTVGLPPREAFVQREAEKTRERSHTALEFPDWAIRIPEAQTGMLDFTRYPYQREPYDVLGRVPNAVVEKGTQVGFSTLCLRWALWVADELAGTVMYVFPVKDQVYKFCCAADERVLMADGSIKRIAEVERGDRVMTEDADGKPVADRVTGVWETGVQEVLRVGMAGGRRIRVTGRHRLMTRRGWLPAEFLRVGDEVRVPGLLPSEHAANVSREDAFLLALWMAEGTKSAKGFVFANALPQIQQRVREIAFARGWGVSEYAPNVFGLTMNGRRRADDSPMGILRSAGVLGMRTDTIKIPPALMSARRDVQEEFMRTYIACDGCVGAREITVASASERMIRDLRVMASQNGMLGTVRVQQPTNHKTMRAGKPSWVLAFGSRPARERIKSMGIPGKPVVMRKHRKGTRFAARDGWAKVEMIEPDGYDETYDLSIAERHSYYLEDALTHNSDQRVKPVIRGSEYLRDRMAFDDPDNKGLKKIGNGYVYFVGSQSVSELDSVPANALVLDEYDELAQVNIPVVERRVGAADSPMIRRIGVPTLDNYGIEREYRSTDMRRWTVKCEACGTWQRIRWENMRYEELAPEEFKAWRVCIECERAIDVRKGEWVAEYPDRPRIGFHAPRLIVPNANLGEVVKARLSEKEEEKRAHYNRDLAEPFETPESRLSVPAIQSCRRADIHLVESYVGFNWVTMGIDVSTTRGLHVRISEHLNEHEKRVLWVGVVDALITANPDVPDQSALRALTQKMAAYKVHMACIDHLPDGLFAKAFAAAHPGRVYLIAYNTDYRARESIKIPKTTDTEPLVTIKRTEWITATLDLFRMQRNLLPLNEPLPKGVEGKTYEEHLRNIVKQRKKDSIGREYYGYEDTGPEDFLQAEVYDHAATRVLQQRLMEQAVAVGVQRQEEVKPPDPTPNLAEWDGRALEHDAEPWRDTYVSGWTDEYRPYGDDSD